MAGVTVEAGSELAQTIQNAVQPKLIESGWVADENDTTLSEYVTMMIVQGKDLKGVTSELGGDLLGVGEDDPSVGAFAQWLFERVANLAGASQPQPSDAMNAQIQSPQPDEAQSLPTDQAQDSQMDDATSAEGIPSGPKAMRSGAGGQRGRGGRMLGQMNNHMNRTDLPDPLRRIKGAAGGQQGRINSHAGRQPPPGPRAQNGMQRMMNGGGRGGPAGMPQANPMMAAGNMMSTLDPNQQMALMQMMEMQANLMNQVMNGQLQPGQQPPQQNGQGRSMFERVNKKHNNNNNNFKNRQQRPQAEQSNGEEGSGMDVDGERKEPFEVVCHFNANCTNPNCPYAHQSPAAPPGQTLDLSDTCSFGVACENRKCAGRHPSPAQRTQHLKQEVDCKFYPNCTNPSCPFRHPEMPLCRNGADCNVSGCKFTHSKIMCRYTPCQRPFCPFKHVEGQRGVFKDKVWTKDGAPNGENGEGGNDAEGKSNRFAEFKENEGQPEELIIPGQENEGSNIQGEAEGIVT